MQTSLNTQLVPFSRPCNIFQDWVIIICTYCKKNINYQAYIRNFEDHLYKVTQYGWKRLWIGPCIGNPIFQHWWLNDEIELVRATNMYFPVALASLISSTTHKCWENGSRILGTGQPIQGPIQRRFGPFFICWVYFILKSTEFHDIHMECK